MTMIQRHSTPSNAPAEPGSPWLLGGPGSGGLRAFRAGLAVLVALLLSGLLLAFGSVVSESVHRNEQLRRQFAAQAGRCDTGVHAGVAVSCGPAHVPTQQQSGTMERTGETAEPRLFATRH